MYKRFWPGDKGRHLTLSSVPYNAWTLDKIVYKRDRRFLEGQDGGIPENIPSIWLEGWQQPYTSGRDRVDCKLLIRDSHQR